MRILVADDDDGTRQFVARALIGDGHEVVAVGDGGAAAEALAAGGFQLLVADIDMPGQDGVSVARSGRAADPLLKVLLITAHPTQLGRAADLGPGGVAALAKPFQLEALRAVVAKLAQGG